MHAIAGRLLYVCRIYMQQRYGICFKHSAQTASREAVTIKSCIWAAATRLQKSRCNDVTNRGGHSAIAITATQVPENDLLTSSQP